MFLRGSGAGRNFIAWFKMDKVVSGLFYGKGFVSERLLSGLGLRYVKDQSLI